MKYDPNDNVFRAAARKLGLTRSEFEKRMLALARKLDLYDRIQRGDAKLRRIWIEPYEIPKHAVTGHWRYIEDRQRTRPATRRIRRIPRLKIIQGGQR